MKPLSQALQVNQVGEALCRRGGNAHKFPAIFACFIEKFLKQQNFV
jgi:hypothetical protein